MTTQLEERFDALADIWRKQTHYHSNTAIIMRHPAINTIIEMGQPAVPLILRRWRDHGGMWQHALSTITGVHITEGITDLTDANQEGIKGWVAISYPTLRAAWLKWGVENQHLDTVESAPQMVRGGYALRHYGFCDDDLCQETRERVYQCPCCTQTFCNQCTDILRWEIEFIRTCPRCGWNPDQTPLTKPESTEAMYAGVDTRVDGQGRANGLGQVPIDGDEGGVK